MANGWHARLHGPAGVQTIRFVAVTGWGKSAAYVTADGIDASSPPCWNAAPVFEKNAWAAAFTGTLGAFWPSAIGHR